MNGHQEGSIYTNTTLSAGGSHTYAILENRNTSCWGAGNNGRLGNGDSWTQYPNYHRPSTIWKSEGSRNCFRDAHTCVILDNGLVSCWGGNFEDCATQTVEQLTKTRLHLLILGQVERL